MSLADENSTENIDFVPIGAGADPDAYFPGANPGDTNNLANSPSDLGKKTTQPFLRDGEGSPTDDGGQD